ncbi:hypothetical protein LNK15_15250, partial [Jeotgalicoccus huakuii]|nr:hypothetical protein [Jeotgalicoccus huakuii]
GQNQQRQRHENGNQPGRGEKRFEFDVHSHLLPPFAFTIRGKEKRDWAMTWLQSIMLVSQPLNEVLGVDLIGLVVAGQH